MTTVSASDVFNERYPNYDGTLDVEIIGALPAGTETIGKLAANSGVDIGDVDVTSIAAGENHLGEMGGALIKVSTEFTRPADTAIYTAGDVVSNSTSATTFMAFSSLGRVAAGSGYIVRASLTTDKKSITPRFRVHLFNALNSALSTAVPADNVPLIEKYADASFRLGSFDLPAMATAADTTNSDMSRAMDNTLRHPVTFAAASQTLYAVLETLDAFTPASGQKFRLTLVLDAN